LLEGSDEIKKKLHTTPMIHDTYEHIISQLKQNIRPRIPNTPELLDALERELENTTTPSEATLCVVSHLANPNKAIGNLLVRIISSSLPTEIQIFILDGIQKHILDERMISGDRLDSSFLMTFNTYLETAPKPALHFAVGIVENCGSQSIFFRNTLKAIQWGFMDAFKQENRSTITRIEALEKRWQKIVK